MKYRELLENPPEYIDSEMTRMKGRFNAISQQTIDRNYTILSKYEYDGLTNLILIANDLKSATIGTWENIENEERLQLKIRLVFHEELQLGSETPEFDLKNVLQVDVVEVMTTTGEGYGYQLYKAIINAGYTLISDNVQYRGGKALWDKIITKSATDLHNVYVIQNGKFLKDRQKNPIKFNGTNLPSDAVWGDDPEHHYALLMVSNK
jgi:hypothetical protein